MVRYKSNSNNPKLSQQNNLISRPKTIINIKNARSGDTNTRTQTRLKRKLLVYKKDGKFYIDYAAAYALKLTNVRAIMLESPHLFEIGLETLHKFQNSEDIEIEYQEFNKEKEVAKRKGDLAKTLESLEQGEYGIGVHGIDRGTIEEKQSKASNISSEGLNIGDNSKTILSTAISLGINEDVSKLHQEIVDYKFGNGTKMSVIIAVPLYVQNENGEKIFLGFPEENKRTAGQQYEEHCVLDRICEKLGKIPPEFILGYYYENSDGSRTFINNQKHYSNITQKEKINLFKELSLSMDDISRNINELIISGNIEQLSQMKERIKQLSMNTYMIDNAIMLAQRYEEEEKMTRRVLLHNEQQPQNNNSLANKRKRKILLDACKGTNLSDLPVAKGILGAGIVQGLELGQDCEGKKG